MSWPSDVDGDVFRRMQHSGFDFAKVYEIDFSVDFERWPPAPEAITALRGMFPSAQVIERETDPDTAEEYGGYLAFRISAHVTYELVMKMPADVTRVMLPFGGHCESWGVGQYVD